MWRASVRRLGSAASVGAIRRRWAWKRGLGSPATARLDGAEGKEADHRGPYALWTTGEILRGIAVLEAAQWRGLSDGVLALHEKLRGGSYGGRGGLLGRAVEAGLRRTVYSHFCGGDTVADCLAPHALPARYQAELGMGFVLDYSTESGESEAHFEEVARRKLDTILSARQLGAERLMTALKPTGLGRYDTLAKASDLLRQRSAQNSSYLDTLSFGDQALDEEWARLQRRLDRICAQGKEAGFPVLIDAEYYAIQPAVEYLSFWMQSKYNSRHHVTVYSTFQLYLRETTQRLRILGGIAREVGFKLGVKQVRGAYLETERRRAEARNVQSPVHDTLQATHDSYNGALVENMQAVRAGCVSLIVASHNKESVGLAAQLATEMRAPKTDVFSVQLYGIGDSLTHAAARDGTLQVYKLIPYGPLDEVLPYLGRRLEENRGMLSGAVHELREMKSELRRRLW